MGLWPSAPHTALSSTDREAALWEMEEYQLQERHQLVKQQLKDQYFLQRHELLRKHEKVRLPRDGHHLGATGAPRRSQVGHGEAREVLGGCLASTQGARNRGTVRKLMPQRLPHCHAMCVAFTLVSFPFPCPTFLFSLSHALGYL